MPRIYRCFLPKVITAELCPLQKRQEVQGKKGLKNLMWSEAVSDILNVKFRWINFFVFAIILSSSNDGGDEDDS